MLILVQPAFMLDVGVCISFMLCKTDVYFIFYIPYSSPGPITSKLNLGTASPEVTSTNAGAGAAWWPSSEPALHGAAAGGVTAVSRVHSALALWPCAGTASKRAARPLLAWGDTVTLTR